MQVEKKIVKTTQVMVYGTIEKPIYLYADKSPMIKEQPLVVSSQFPYGDIHLTYHRLNGAVEELYVDKNAKLSQYMRVYEFLMDEATCKKYKLSVGRCKRLILHEKLVMFCDFERAKWGNSFNVSSGYRDEEYNEAVGGVENSSHKKGKGVDYSITNLSKSKTLASAKENPWCSYAYTNTTNMKYRVHANIA